MLKQGLDWLRGSQSVSMGSISTGQTNPDEPDYFPPFLHKKLVQAGLVAFVQTTNFPEETGYPGFNEWGRDTDNINKVPSLDSFKESLYS